MSVNNFWTSPTRPNSSLPATVDMVIVGGNFTAMFLAKLVAEQGLSICLLSARPTFADDISLKETGQISLGVGDNPFRLCMAIGEEATKEILQCAQMGIDLLQEIDCSPVTGGFHIAKDQREVTEIIESTRILQHLGFPCEHVSAPEINTKLHTKGLLDGWFSPQEMTIDLHQLTQKLVAAIAPLPFIPNCRVSQLIDTPSAVVVKTNQGDVQTQTIIYCGDHAELSHHDFFADRLYPIRAQCIGVPIDTPLPYGCSAQYGYIYWRDFQQFRLIGGCRWATPHLEVGESNDRVIVDKIDFHLQNFARNTFGIHQTPTHKWTGIRTNTCDGLPIVGPLPGRPDIIACCGFNGQQLPLGISSAKAVFDLLMHGETNHLPKKFESYRFL